MNSSSESVSRDVSLPCPWCGEPYERFVWHDAFDGGGVALPADACETPLGFWVHEDGDGDG